MVGKKNFAKEGHCCRYSRNFINFRKHVVPQVIYKLSAKTNSLFAKKIEWHLWQPKLMQCLDKLLLGEVLVNYANVS